MPFIGVPWAVEGGAENGAENARILAYAASGAGDGVITAADLRVTPTATASAAVAVSTGGAIIRCRTAGYASQSYVGSRPTADDTVPVPANGGAATAFHMVVAQVRNPWLAAETWPTPPSVTAGPYVGAYLLSNVGESAATDPVFARAYLRDRGLSAIPLAGLTLPPNTSSVLGSHIIDLRRLAQPKSQRRLLTYTPPARANVPGSWGVWIEPDGAAWELTVPEWATRVALNLTVHGAKCDKQSSSVDGKTNGALRIVFGDNNPVTTQTTRYDFDAPNNSGATRSSVGVADTIAVPVGFRDTLQPFRVEGDQEGGNQPLYVDTYSSVTLDVEFIETPI